jgi:UDP-N-acetylmuramoyl-tripeptide--D-alanyl-D-alanine ligase
VIAVAASDLVGATLGRGDPRTVIDRVEIDSRAAGPGALFVAIRRGHDHVTAAQAAGAAVLVDASRTDVASGDTAVLAAPDPIAALQAIGAANRAAAARCRVVAVTGSSGKTSTKDILAAMIAPQRVTIAAAEGHNNEIGLPLTLTRITTETEVSICELAMRGPGQIEELALLARPDVGVITNVGEAHLELLGSREAIAAAKAELISHVATIIVPAAEALLASHVAGHGRIVTFGEAETADVRIVGRRGDEAGMTVEIRGAGRPLTVTTNLTGAHQALNIAAAIAVCEALGLDLDACAAAARSIALQRWRGEEHSLGAGGVVVNDAYNANPSSVEAALRALAERGRGRLVAVLGPMAELGPSAEALHRRVGAAAAELGYRVIIAVGEPARAYLDGAGSGVQGHWLENRDDLVAYLGAVVRPDDRVLVKASRAAGLEGVAAGLAARLANGAAK